MHQSLLSLERIKTGIIARDWEDLVDQIGDMMVRAGDTQSSYTQAMKNVIKEIGPYCVIAPGIVLLHARPEEGVNRLCLALGTLAEGVKFGSANDPVFFAIGLGAVDHESHLTLLAELADLLQNKELVKKVISAKDNEEVLSLVTSSVTVHKK